MNIMTETQTTRPHALAIDLLKEELTKAGQQVIYYGNKARQAAARPKRDGAEFERADKQAGQWRDRHARLQESLLVLEEDQRARATAQAERDQQLPEAAAEAISKFFIKRPDALEIIGSKYLGNGYWDVETRVTYAGTDKPEPRQFLLVRTTDYRLLVNP